MQSSIICLNFMKHVTWLFVFNNLMPFLAESNYQKANCSIYFSAIEFNNLSIWMQNTKAL